MMIDAELKQQPQILTPFDQVNSVQMNAGEDVAQIGSLLTLGRLLVGLCLLLDAVFVVSSFCIGGVLRSLGLLLAGLDGGHLNLRLGGLHRCLLFVLLLYVLAMLGHLIVLLLYVLI